MTLARHFAELHRSSIYHIYQLVRIGHHGKITFIKTAVETAHPQEKAIELRDTVIPGLVCKITPAGRRVFMPQYRTNTSERRKPAKPPQWRRCAKSSCRGTSNSGV